MFQSILAAIDGSQKSGAALDIAIGEAKLHGAALHVVYVIETGLFSSIPMDNTWEVIYGLLENQGRDAHLAAARKVRDEPLRGRKDEPLVVLTGQRAVQVVAAPLPVAGRGKGDARGDQQHNGTDGETLAQHGYPLL